MNPNDYMARFLPRNLRPKPDPQIAIRALMAGARALDVRCLNVALNTLRQNGETHTAGVRSTDQTPVWRPLLDALVLRPAATRAAVACLTLLRDKGLKLDMRDSRGVSLAEAIATAPQGAALAQVWTQSPHWRDQARAVSSKNGPLGSEATQAFWRQQIEQASSEASQRRLETALPPVPPVQKPRL